MSYKLTEGHLDQIVGMYKDEKTYVEIIDFFKKTYNIKLWRSEVSGIIKKAKKEGEMQRGKYKDGRSRRKKASRDTMKECRFKAICKFADNCRLEICKFYMKENKDSDPRVII